MCVCVRSCICVCVFENEGKQCLFVLVSVCVGEYSYKGTVYNHRGQGAKVREHSAVLGLDWLNSCAEGV